METLASFFYESLKDSPLNGNIKIYLVNLLLEPPTIDEPLAFLLKNALDADVFSKFSHAKTLGDVSLTLVAIFPENIKKRNITVSYCYDMGRSGYYLAGKSARKNNHSANVYNEISENFHDVVRAVRKASYRTYLVQNNYSS
jgi:hypothetical protein